MMLLILINNNRVVKVAAATATTSNCEEDEHNRNQTECSGMIGCCEWNENTNTCVSVADRNDMSCNNKSNNTSADANSTTNTSSNDIDLCDESKCVAYNRELVVFVDSLFSCYYGTTHYGKSNMMMCADGYIPQVVTNSGIYNNYDDDDTDEDDGDDFKRLHYFTCCPPTSLPATKPMQRHCSDPIIIDDDDDESNITIIGDNITGCNDSMQPYMRMMKTHFVANSDWHGRESSEKSYVCCDTKIDDYNDNGTAHFLNSTECT